MVRHGVKKNVSMKDAPIMNREEDSALSMEQRSLAAAKKDAPMIQRKEVSALGIAQSKSNNMTSSKTGGLSYFAVKAIGGKKAIITS